ncbi:hypothetical protein GF339_05235 [candidate division KSB3 bacterium]|uniref:Carbohydrate-binding domain-containing protein n=1 Tax=candidate division KSB3 bacterium TaxID=2044937 RepID=A0A9D5JTT7_9BACT|nr:hypothetical protein [candidate division KSB3 bacterium]MBD3323965.1 hypothetical protein [candidate division KSB3 bacterium]
MNQPHGTPLTYTIHWTETPPSYQGQWDSPVWQRAETAYIAHFHPQSSWHHPLTAVKVLYDDEQLYVFFRVADRFVKAVSLEYQEPVYQDSCVEFFIRPRAFYQSEVSPAYQGYFNVEINCIGTMLVSYIEDWRRTDEGFAQYAPLPPESGKMITVFHSLSGQIVQEIESPVEWMIGYNVPFALFEGYLGPLDFGIGRPWRGNFYKCADRSSHPHWASWAPIGAELNFHQPKFFGRLEFGN